MENEIKTEQKLGNETIDERCARLGTTICSEKRREVLEIANALVDDKLFHTLCDAVRVARSETIVLPAHRFEGLSRGKGWARKGKGTKAEWGEHTGSGYLVGPGEWVVGGNDGFSRKGEDTWTVKHVLVGETTWSVAV